MAYRVMLAVTIALCVAATGCSNAENEDCPDRGRLSYLPPTTDALAEQLAVNDCLAEYGAKLARGDSSNTDVVQALVAQCGTYNWNGNNGDEGSDDMVKAEAMRVVVADRALNCPLPRHRGFDGKFATVIKSSWQWLWSR